MENNENLTNAVEQTKEVSTKLNGKDKLKFGAIVTGIAAAGYAVGNYVIKPGVKWIAKKFTKKKVKDAPAKKTKKEPEESRDETEETENTEE